MDNFPKEYFCRENREGFCISEIMKRAWANQLDVLQKIDQICEKYNLKYYACWGTLLGAVRHHGYIPWDDDVDIVMLRDDYIKFLEVAPNELPEKFVLQSMYTNDSYTNYFANISNMAVIDCSMENISQNHGFPFAVTLDIFPMYYIPRNKEEEKVLRELLTLIGQLCGLLELQENIRRENNCDTRINDLDIKIANGLVQLEKACGYKFTTDKNLKVQLTILYDQLCRIYEEDESDYVTAFPNYLTKGYKIKKELFEPIEMPFENRMINVPKGYDTILSMTYGDYMKPVRGRAAHDYPYFRSQIKMLGRRIELLDIKEKQQKAGCDFKDKYKENDKQVIVLYSPSAAGLLNNSECAVEKIKNVLELIKKNSNIKLWWYVYNLVPNEFEVVSIMAPNFFKEYNALLDLYRKEKWLIMDESGDYSRAVTECNMFYGDEGILSDLFEKTGKPIMYQNYELLESR